MELQQAEPQETVTGEGRHGLGQSEIEGAQ